MAQSIYHQVSPLTQPNDRACWATALAMVANYKNGTDYSPEEIAQAVGASAEACNEWHVAQSVGQHWGLNTVWIGDQPLDPDTLEEALGAGPIYAVIEGDPTHAVVVTGITGDGTHENTQVYVMDPLRGERAMDFLDFMHEHVKATEVWDNVPPEVRLMQ